MVVKLLSEVSHQLPYFIITWTDLHLVALALNPLSADSPCAAGLGVEQSLAVASVVNDDLFLFFIRWIFKTSASWVLHGTDSSLYELHGGHQTKFKLCEQNSSLLEYTAVCSSSLALWADPLAALDLDQRFAVSLRYFISSCGRTVETWHRGVRNLLSILIISSLPPVPLFTQPRPRLHVVAVSAISWRF
ncbi:hypothetical protein RRG08_062677 [Elysia crispata]|uniref:Uncharacterized protein n=1 Tax=Elysia crispata TaxID=231223 RepID=A0AAE0XMB6_9GAST|nr:hypothetical protein RRG08_062677 [Elysia crispata]